LEENIIAWVKRLSQKRDELGGFSICPFAKKALEDKKVFWSYIGYEVEDYISRYMEANTEDYEVIIFFNVTKNLTNQDCIDIIGRLNKSFSDIIFLKDHPSEPGFINGVSTGNEEYPIILAQPKGKLMVARNTLKKTKYYDYWEDEYKKEIWSYGDESRID
jgi:hypothetical protein